MKILHVIPGLAARYGGPAAVIRPLLGALSRLPGTSVEVAATDADGPDRLNPQACADWPFKVHLLPRTWSERWKFSWGLWTWLAERARQYDLLHVHAAWTFSTYAACRASRIARTPVVMSPCGMLLPYSFQRFASSKRLYWTLIERHNLETVRRFHATSTPEAGALAKLKPDVPTSIIPLGMDDAALTAPRETAWLRTRCGAPAADLPIVLFLGRMHPVKGIVDLLLPAFSQLRTKAFLALAGGPDGHAPGYEREIEQTIARLGLRERVALLGAIAPDDRWRLFDGAAVFVLPSQSENFGMVVAEAMARGAVPLVADAVQSCEHVLAADAGRVSPRDPTVFARHLDELLEDDAVRARYSGRGRQYAAEHFAWDGIAQQFAAMYRQVLAPAS